MNLSPLSELVQAVVGHTAPLRRRHASVHLGLPPGPHPPGDALQPELGGLRVVYPHLEAAVAGVALFVVLELEQLVAQGRLQASVQRPAPGGRWSLRGTAAGRYLGETLALTGEWFPVEGESEGEWEE